MKALEVMNGKFGKRVLKPRYITYWCMLTWGTATVVAIRVILVPILEWWSGIVDMLNYIIWG